MRLPCVGSGSLIAPGNGHYILTVAHNDPAGAGGNVIFKLQRNGTPVSILIPVPANPAGAAGAADQFAINHPASQNLNNAISSVNDIALWKLVDPVSQQPNRFLVAPFGAQQYPLYTQTNEETNPATEVTMVGYGRTGVGNTGIGPFVPVAQRAKRMGR